MQDIDLLKEDIKSTQFMFLRGLGPLGELYEPTNIKEKIYEEILFENAKVKDDSNNSIYKKINVDKKNNDKSTFN